MKTLIESAAAAKAASTAVAQLTTEQKNAALLAMAGALEANCAEILAANAADMERERANGMSPDMLDRLMLNEKRVADMALGLRQVAELPDPVGEVMREWTRPNGLKICKVRVPMGVIGIIYEARPNVTVDAASLAFKAGSAILLRGSGSAYESNAAEVRVMRAALEGVGVTPDAICLVEERGHDVVDNMLRLREYIDLIVPRGSARLINNAVEKATVPILQTGTGNCHVYIDESADYAMAEAIVVNAKTQELHGDERAAAYTAGMIPATEADWADEYLRLAMAVKVVPDVKAAVGHINHYGTKHTECIVSSNEANAEYFLKNVDAAVVDWNASTRFTDGFEFGFGAELGISTQKLHARGPMGLEEITSYKYLVIGTGQVRP